MTSSEPADGQHLPSVPPQPASPVPTSSAPPAVPMPPPMPSTVPLRQMLVSTMNDVPGYEVVAVLGEVFGIVVRSRNLFSNIGAGFRTIFGGEVRGYTKLLTDTRYEAVERLRAEAASVGANAVIAMRFDTGEFAGAMNEVAAYGTAVVLRPASHHTPG